MAKESTIKVFFISLIVVSLSLCSNASAVDFDGAGLSEDGKFHLSIVPPTTMEEKYKINEMISNLTQDWGITSGGEWNCNENFTSCKLVYHGSDWTDDYYDIVYEYDADAKAKIEEVLKDFEIPESGFKISDTELLEYWVFGGNTALSNFSSEIKSALKNYNILVHFEARGGAFEPLVSHNIGTVEIFFNGSIYATIGGMPEPKAVAPHIFYVPSGVSEDKLADALRERLAGIYGEELNDIIDIIPTDDKVRDLIDGSGDFDNLFDNYLDSTVYELDIDFGGMGDVQSIIIVSDSDKIKEPSKLNSTDLLTDINISANSAVLPDDAVTYAENLGNKKDEVIEKALGTDIYSVYEIGLYSYALDEQVSDIDNDEFSVTIPISENLKGIEALSAYWINFETGEPEEHRATISGNNAIFKTNHFSTYILAESTKEEKEEEEKEDSAEEDEESDEKENDEKTSDTGVFFSRDGGASPILPISIAVIIISLGFTFFIIRKIRSRREDY